MLANAYLTEKRYDDCIQLLESTPYFVNWEGQDVTRRLFTQSHIQRGRQRLDGGDAPGALADFQAALTYPANLNVGRSNKPQEGAGSVLAGQGPVGFGPSRRGPRRLAGGSRWRRAAESRTSIAGNAARHWRARAQRGCWRMKHHAVHDRNAATRSGGNA